MPDRPKHPWPKTVTINLKLCARCGDGHGEIEFRRFELGDRNSTHWAYCPATGEPLLINMARPQQKEPDKFFVRFIDTGKKSTLQPNPRYPDGVDVNAGGIPEGKPGCLVKLPYPAKGVGGWQVECTECGARMGCTAAGRADDPRSITIQCKE